MSNTSNTSEQAFEWLIEKALVGSTLEERGAADVDAQSPTDEQYYWGLPKDYDKKLGFDLRRLWAFLHATQQDILDEYKGGDITVDLPKQLSKKIETFGIIEVLRGGLELANLSGSKKIRLFFPKPSKGDSAVSWERYRSNQFSLTRQATYAVKRPGEEIDMVIYVNGLPIFTFELKNPWTHQTAKYDAIKQYREDRDPSETILQFGRCLAHFAVDKNEVYFTTRLAKAATYFMPFNQGLPDGQGAGNPVNPDGYKTAYLWERILQKDVVADIIQNYVLFDYGETKTQKKVPHIMRNAKVLIFPRFHQLDVVQRLVADVQQVGVGKRYLIEHSAGSGKSNSLTWLAFKLINTFADSLNAVNAKSTTEPLFNSVVVVTDRRLLDKQITDNIKAFGQSDKIIAHADTSRDLKEAIEGGKRIIITTIQKFPFICDTIANVNDKNFAVVIDEAHSSQSGNASATMNATMQRDPDQTGGDIDELIAKMVRDKKMSTNCSYFAFTATPKRETLEKFGTQTADGEFVPFHLYSMKQAIEEGFILDVLANYTTYKSYYELIKSVADNPEFNNARAQRELRKAVERDPKTIEAKARVMLEHFDAQVFRCHKLKGKAKAMVVTKDIECAIRYYHALCRIAEEMKLPYHILIAFSDTKKVDGTEYTEAQLNGFPDSKTAENFNEDDNRILVVANKYLTGFDQPKLSAMYIDKPLDGVLAVQALSRLNRAAPSLGKLSTDLFILDFYNSREGIQEAFNPFYTATKLSEATDVNVLHDLKSALLSVGVFDMEEVEAFAELFFKGAEADQFAPIIDAAAARFNKELELEETDKADFKMKAKQFNRVYAKVSTILSYEVVEWEKLYWYLYYLIPELVVKDQEKDNLKDLLQSVDLNTYGLRRTSLNEKIELESAEATLDPNKPVMVHAGDGDDEPVDPLDQILQDFNERWFKGWQATPDDQKAKLINITKAVVADEDYNTLVVGNPDQEAVETALAVIIDRAIRQQRKGDMSLYKEYQHNEGFKANFRNVISRMLSNLDYIR